MNTDELVQKSASLVAQFQYYGMTDKGLKRRENQDHFLIACLRKAMSIEHSSISLVDHSRFFSDISGHLLMVADGMGGHAGGELASELTVDTAATYVLNTVPWFYRLNQIGETDCAEELKKAVIACQQQLAQRVAERPAYAGMGTTLTMAYVYGFQLYLVHVGDSRCYLYRNGHLHQITRDHTLAQELVDAGQLSPESAVSSPFGHVLWNAVGGSDTSDLKPDIHKLVLEPEDRLLMCTDGLTRHVPPATLQSTLAERCSEEDRCMKLIAAANAAGGSDNITVITAHVVTERDAPCNGEPHPYYTQEA